jgi:hypothetical protein
MAGAPHERVECTMCSLPAVVEDREGVGYCAAHYARVYRFRIHMSKLGAALAAGAIRRGATTSPRAVRTRRRYPGRA